MKNIKEYLNNENIVNEGCKDTCKQIFTKLKDIFNLSKDNKPLSKDEDEILNNYLWAVDNSDLSNSEKRELLKLLVSIQD